MPDIRFTDEIIPAVMWSSAIMPVLSKGHSLKIPLAGLSMYPLLVGGRDEVILVPAVGKRLKRGDIVLYVRDDGTHVLHRIHHIKGDAFFMLGDAQTWIEGSIKRESILALADTVIRKSRRISCKRLDYRVLSATWLLLRPARPVIIRIARIIIEFLQKMKRK